jgi:hypothetical protein
LARFHRTRWRRFEHPIPLHYVRRFVYNTKGRWITKSWHAPRCSTSMVLEGCGSYRCSRIGEL